MSQPARTTPKVTFKVLEKTQRKIPLKYNLPADDWPGFTWS